MDMTLRGRPAAQSNIAVAAGSGLNLFSAASRFFKFNIAPSPQVSQTWGHELHLVWNSVARRRAQLRTAGADRAVARTDERGRNYRQTSSAGSPGGVL